MGDFLNSLIEELEIAAVIENNGRALDSLAPLPRLEITLLEQISLLVRSEVTNKIPLASTSDFDAWITSSWELKRILTSTLEKFGLHYDQLSKEIWMDPDAKKEILYESDLLKIEAFHPIDVIVSKALKAPEKNKFLVQHGLLLYGSALEEKLKKFNIDKERFLK